MISPFIKKALTDVKEHTTLDIYTEDHGPAISVNSLTTKAGSLYEKFRYMIDYKEEHTIRRSAVERILKRVVMMKAGDDTGAALIQEFVSAKYLPNERVSESVAKDVQAVVDKYRALQEISGVEQNIILSLAASEIDRLLFPKSTDEAIVEAFYNVVVGSVQYEGDISGSDLETQTYIACRRSLLADDQEMLFYALVTRRLPWLGAITGHQEQITAAGEQLREVIDSSRSVLNHPLSFKISAKLRNHAIYFRVIRELVETYGADAETIFENPVQLEEDVAMLLSKEYAEQGKRLQKSGVRAVVYILLTKMVIAGIIEFPYEKYILGKIDYLALGTNIVFHPALLFLIVKTAKKPNAQNTNLVIEGVKNIVYDEGIKPIYVRDNKRSPVTNAMFITFYLILYAISFGVILYVLNLIHFNIVSIGLFIFFVTIVSYFGFRLRYNAQKWTVSVKKGGFLSLAWNFFTFPIVRTGRWLSRKFSSVNVFVLLLDFIIETPFKFVLGTFDSFVHYLREREEDPL